MVSFFSHGFASGGESTKQGEKKSKEGKEGTWVPVVDGRGQIVNWQHSVTGAYWAPVHQVVGGAFAVQPVAQQAFQPVNPWGMNVMTMPPPMAVGVVVNGEKKKEKGKENKGGYWDTCHDENGMRFYKHSRTNKVTYTDPYY